MTGCLHFPPFVPKSIDVGEQNAISNQGLDPTIWRGAHSREMEQGFNIQTIQDGVSKIIGNRVLFGFGENLLKCCTFQKGWPKMLYKCAIPCFIAFKQIPPPCYQQQRHQMPEQVGLKIHMLHIESVI